MNRRKNRKLSKRLTGAMAISAAVAGMAMVRSAQAQSSGPAESPSSLSNFDIISLSGSSALKNWYSNAGFTEMLSSATNTATISLSMPASAQTSGVVTVTQVGSQAVQLAPASASQASSYNTAGSLCQASVLATETHVSGSIEGIIENVADQTNNASGISLFDDVSRAPTSGNNIYVNSNALSAVSTPVGGFQLGTWNQNQASNQGQAAVQVAMSDVMPIQGFSVGGTSSAAMNSGSVFATPGSAGYGKGNPALALVNASGTSGLGVVQSRQQLVDATYLNVPGGATITVRGTNQTVAAGSALTTGGVNNLSSQEIATTATLFAANPGTGLDKLNQTQAQWLQSTSRLPNGATFNMAERDAYSGTRNMAALNTGIDPSFAVGLNDGGNGNLSTGATTQIQVGNGVTFSGKTSGGSQMLPTIQANRMAVGVISLSDGYSAFGNGGSFGGAPVRALAYGNFAASTSGLNTNNIGTNTASNFTEPTFSNIVYGRYWLWQQEQFVTLKAPDGSIVGDNANQDVSQFLGMVNKATTNWDSLPGTADPADTLAAQRFILPDLMQVSKTTDGTTGLSGPPVGAVSPSSAIFQDFQTDYAANFMATNYNPAAVQVSGNASYDKYGVTSKNPATFSGGSIPVTSSGTASGNWLFGNFNQNGIRDLSAVLTAQAAQAALFNALGSNGTSVNLGSATSNATVFDPTSAGNTSGFSTAFGTNWSTISSNLTALKTGLSNAGALGGASKGDMITMGDYSARGVFDGNDLWHLAVGASLVDSTATNGSTLSIPSGGTLGDAIASGYLKKNTALDAMNSAVGGWVPANGTNGTTATPGTWQAYQRQTAYGSTGSNTTAYNANFATQALARDPNGQFAFSKYDVLHNGAVDFNSCYVVNQFVGQSYTSLTNQVNAVVVDPTYNPNQSKGAGTNQTVAFNMTQAKIIDDGTTTISEADVNAEAAAAIAAGGLLAGDLNFDGKVDISDLQIFGNNWGLPVTNYTQGHLTSADGGIENIADLQIFGNNWGLSLSGGSAVTPAEYAEGEAMLSALRVTPTPEPASLGLLALGAGALVARRRRSRRA